MEEHSNSFKKVFLLSFSLDKRKINKIIIFEKVVFSIDLNKKNWKIECVFLKNFKKRNTEPIFPQ